MMVKKTASFVTLICILLITGITDRTDAQYSVDMTGIISTDTQTPFWFQSNRNGIYSREGSQFLTQFSYDDIFFASDHINVLYGASLLTRPGKFSTISFNRGYIKIRGFGFELAAGRYIHTSPDYDINQGLGSLGISRNSTPIPRVSLGIYDWAPVPFTKEFIEIKGYIAHGWLGSERFTEDVLLHEKEGFLKVGGSLPVNVYAGLAHYATWGGNNHPTQGDIPHRLSDYKNVFFVLGGDEFTPGQEQTYALGDHLGVWEFGATVELDNLDIKLYRQFPIETKYNLKLKSEQDALTGIYFEFDEESSFPLHSFVYEYLYTKFQAGPRRPNVGGDLETDIYRGNQNYYNHGLYRTGWTYHQRTIGNPLFKVSDENLGILNNRIVAHHIGLESALGRMKIHGKATFSRNYGKRCDNRVPNIGEKELFNIRCENVVNTVRGRSLDQWSFLAGFETPFVLSGIEDLYLRFEFALDNGRLFGDQFGVLTSLRWAP